MPSVFLSPSTQENNYYVNGGTEEQYMNLVCDRVIPYLNASGISYTRNDRNQSAAAAIRQAAPDINLLEGRIASGDQFVAVKELKERIIANTQGLCTEMEGAAIAQTAYRNNVPFVILRAISDKADDSAEMDYPTFEKMAARRCAQVTQLLAKKMQENVNNVV